MKLIFILSCLVTLLYSGHCEPVTKIHCEFLISKEWERQDYVCDITGLNIDTKTHSISDFPIEKHVHGKYNADVTAVHLNEQHIRYIPGGLQAIFPNMTTINIRNSSLTYISMDDFKDLTNMFVIAISNNPIKQVPEDTFTGLSTLQRLELSACKIKTLFDKTFIDLVELTNLNLSGNEIEEITEFLFATNTKLVQVNLIHNRIKLIAATAFDELNFIENIWMTDNVCINDNVLNRLELHDFTQKLTENCSSINTKPNDLKSELCIKHMVEIEKMQSRLTKQNEEYQELEKLNNKLKDLILNVAENATEQKQNSKFSYRFIVVLITFVGFIILSNFIYQKCFKVHHPDGSFETLEHQLHRQ